MKKGDLVKYKSRKFLTNGVFGIILSDHKNRFRVLWLIKGRFTEIYMWYRKHELRPLTLDSSKDLLSKAL